MSVYRESQRIVQKYPARWAQVAEPLHLSKFARNFILPFLAAAFLLLATFLSKVVIGNTGFAMLLTVIGAAVICLIVALWLFIRNYSPSVRGSRTCGIGRGLCQGIAEGGESTPAVAAAGFDN